VKIVRNVRVVEVPVVEETPAEKPKKEETAE
jgi:hypothetical protein